MARQARESRLLFLGLAVATLLAGALRFARLGSVPVALYCDEAFSAYESWSLLLTGRDTRGVPFPFFFDIFGMGWGEPLHIYLSVPSVALFGLTPFAARFVAAAAGTLAVPVTGLMTRSLLRGWRWGSPVPAGIAAAVLMAVSPWAFHFSRIAFQASLLPLTFAAGFWLASRSLGRPSRPIRLRELVPAAVVLGLSLYAYTVARAMMPLLVIGFAWFHRHRFAGSNRTVLIVAATLVAMTLPIAGFSLTEEGQRRFSDVTIFSRDDVSGGGLPALVSGVARNYVSYFTPRFLLTEGDPNPRHSIRGHGVLHPHGLLMLVLGVVACLTAGNAGSRFLLWWLMVYPAAASLTVDPRHAVRAISGQPALYAIAGAGASLVWSLVYTRSTAGAARRVLSVALIVLVVGVSLVSVAGYLHDYFIEYPIYSGPAWQYGMREMYEYVETIADEHDSIYITRNEDFPYIHLLFYGAVPPSDYQARGLADTKYLFDQEVFYRGEEIPNRSNPIFVLKPYETDPRLEVWKEISYPDGTTAFVIAW